MGRHPAHKERHKVTPVADNENDLADDGPVDPVTGKRGDRSATDLDRRVGATVRHFRDDVVKLTRDEVNAILNTRFPREPWDEARLARIEAGTKRLTLVDVWRVIEAMGVSPALFGQKAGLYRVPVGVEEAILADPNLGSLDRQALVFNYQDAVRRFKPSAQAN